MTRGDAVIDEGPAFPLRVPMIDVDGAFFGVYADRETLPDVDGLAAAIDESVDELLALTRRPGRVLSEA